MEKEEKKKYMKFYKKVWYSITKFDKYLEMSNEGTKRASNYLTKLVFIMAVVVTVIGIYDINQKIDKGLKYLKDEVEDFSYSEKQLKSEISETIKFEDSIFGLGNIIIDLETEQQEVIDNYKNEIYEGKSKAGFVLLKDKIIQISHNRLNDESSKDSNTANETTYDYIAANILGKTNISFNKADIVEFLDTSGRIYICGFNFVMYLFGYFIAYLTSTVIYALLLTLIGNITGIITKVKLKFKALYAISVYALTLPSLLNLIYFIITYFWGLQIKYFDVAYLAIAYVYIITVIFLIKADNGKTQEIKVEEQDKSNEESKENELNQNDVQ